MDRLQQKKGTDSQSAQQQQSYRKSYSDVEKSLGDNNRPESGSKTKQSTVLISPHLQMLMMQQNRESYSPEQFLQVLNSSSGSKQNSPRTFHGTACSRPNSNDNAIATVASNQETAQVLRASNSDTDSPHNFYKTVDSATNEQLMSNTSSSDDSALNSRSVALPSIELGSRSGSSIISGQASLQLTLPSPRNISSSAANILLHRSFYLQRQQSSREFPFANVEEPSSQSGEESYSSNYYANSSFTSQNSDSSAAGLYSGPVTPNYLPAQSPEGVVFNANIKQETGSTSLMADTSKRVEYDYNVLQRSHGASSHNLNDSNSVASNSVKKGQKSAKALNRGNYKCGRCGQPKVDTHNHFFCNF